jgi:4-hydroxyphenylpyruvate dioxygenase-like putative hemolysin
MKGDTVPAGGRVSHVVYCVEAQHFDEAVAFWSSAMGVVFDAVDIPGAGLRIMFAEDAGIEVIAPTDDDAGRASIAQAFLDDHAEGVFGVVYRIHAMEPAIEAAASQGVGVVRRVSFTGIDPWSRRYDALEEAHLGPLHGMRVTLGKIDYRDE